MSKYLKQMEKALSVFHKAHAKLEKTLTNLARETNAKQDSINKLELELNDLTKVKTDVWTMRNRVSSFLGIGQVEVNTEAANDRT